MYKRQGQMGDAELSKVWQGVVSGDTDVLVCTTIIETGVDIPNANTLIIENADQMGLSQLYQIRGRVGRSDRRAYVYFTYRKDKSLTEDASKRLEAIKEFTEFGLSLIHISTPRCRRRRSCGGSSARSRRLSGRGSRSRWTR